MKNPILDLSFQFALDVIEYSEQLEECKKFVLARQLLKSGTSIGANVREAQACESKLDFVHKLKIASKEAQETEYWLLLCKYAPSYPKNEKLVTNNQELLKILSSIITTCKKNLN
jgi:four helix bundle protein